MTFLKGLVEGNLNEVKQQDINEDKIYIVKDLPENSITNDIMQAVLTDNIIAAFFQLNNTYICTDDGNYTKGHTYKFTGNAWEDLTQTITTTQTISSTSTSEEIPSAKAVYDYISSLNATEVSY